MFLWVTVIYPFKSSFIKGLISKTQKKLTQLDSKKVNKLIKKNKN